MASRAKAPSLPDERSFVATVDAVACTSTMISLLEARRDRALQRVQASYAAKLAPLITQRDQMLTLAEKYAEEHRAELLPKGSKSVETGLATYGFRLGNRMVKPIGRSSVELVLSLLLGRKLFRFIRTKQELNKEAILSAYRDSDGVIVVEPPKPATEDQEAKPEVVIAPAAIGLRIAQEETFYIEAKVESAAPVKTEGRAA